MTANLSDLGPDQIGIIQQPFRGCGHRVPQAGDFHEVVPGVRQGKLVFAEAGEKRSL